MRKALAVLAIVIITACATATSNPAAAASPKDLPGYAQPYDRVFAASIDAVSMLSWEITVAEMDAGLISAKTPPSFESDEGEKITIRLFEPDSLRGDTLTRIGFTSRTDLMILRRTHERNQKRFFEKLNAILTSR